MLRPKGIAGKLVSLSRAATLHGNKVEGIERLLLASNGDLANIFVLLKYYTGVDFTHYKKTTVERRIKRRMGLTQKATLREYFKYLHDKPAEISALFQDLLINVTSFFRDPKLFKILEKKIFPEMLKRKRAGQPVRIWVPACSTGEEAYSLAISWRESLGHKADAGPVQVFATDVNAAVIEKARRGLYPESIKADIPPAVFRRYFVKESSGYRIVKSVRDMCVFAEQDLTADPPFSKLDLISCRNMLIYMDKDLQKKIIPLFYYALNSAGFLVLGSAETVSDFAGLFRALDKKFKVYAKKESLTRPAIPFALRPYRIEQAGTVKKRSAVTDGHRVPCDAQDERTQAMDEELRSALEEIQSANEELGTLNDELTSSNLELSALTSDMLNLFNSTRMPVIMVGRDLCIHRFTPMAQKVWNIIPSDVGRRLTDINPNVKVLHLEEMLVDAIDHLKTTEKEVRDKEGRWYSMVVSPYKTVDNKIDGAVIALADIHTIKMAQEKYAAAGEYFEDIVEAVPEALVVLDKHLRVKTANQSFYQQFQVESKKAQGQLIYDLDHCQWNIPALRKLLREALSREISVDDFELSHKFAHIGARTLLLSCRIIVENMAGEKMLLLGIKDITDRKCAQERIAWLSSFPELNPNPVYEMDFSGKLLYENPAATRLKREGLALPLGDGAKELLHIFRHSGKKQMLREVWINERWYLQGISKVPGVDALRIYNIDIDTRKQAESELLKQRELSQQYLQIAGVMMGVLNAQGQITLINKKGLDILGYQDDKELLGRNWFDVVLPESRVAQVKKVFDQLMAGDIEPVEYYENSLVCRDGQERLIAFHNTVLWDSTHKITGILFSGEDVTQRRRAEAALQKAKEEAEAAAKAKSQFLNNIAHDFRTPLHAIMGFSALLKSEQLTEKQKKFVGIIHENGSGLLCLVEDLLDVSRLQSGKIELRSIEVDLKACVASAFELSKVMLLNKDVKMSFSVEEGIPRLKGDVVRLGQVLSNLMGNAVKYTDKGEISLSVKRMPGGSCKGKCRVGFFVKDTGMGIPRAKQDQIFNAFTRLNEFDGNKERAGVGLGLYITKTLVDMMKGEISVFSEVGRGSEFVVAIDFDVLA